MRSDALSREIEAAMLLAFVKESNRIENIRREPTKHELDVHRWFLALDSIVVNDLEVFVEQVAGERLRRRGGMNVRITGDAHLPPRGGPWIERELADLLKAAQGGWSPYDVHVEYERLHPFMDGNGRSGRVLWAWMMQQRGEDPFALPFLHRWYYQSLDGARR